MAGVGAHNACTRVSKSRGTAKPTPGWVFSTLKQVHPKLGAPRHMPPFTAHLRR